MTEPKARTGRTIKNGELLAEIQGTRKEIENVNKQLGKKASKWLVVLLGLSVILSLGVAVGGIAFAVTQSHRDCVQSNKGREDIRDMVYSAQVESAEALIDVFPDADPSTVEAFRESSVRRAENNIERLENRSC